MNRGGWLLFLLLVVAACEDESQPVSQARRALAELKASEQEPAPADRSRSASSKPPAEPSAPPAEMPGSPRGPAPGAPSAGAEASCTVSVGPRRVWPAPGPSALVAHEGGALLTAYVKADGGEQVVLLELDARARGRPLWRQRLAKPLGRPRRAPPAIAAGEGGRVAVAASDGAGNVLLAQPEGGGPRFRTVGDGADPRFAPALRAQGAEWLLAWTDGRSTPMRTRVLRVDRFLKTLGEHDVTAAGHGAAAGTFVAGAPEPQLVTFDARDGMSAVLRVRFDEEGAPGEPRVVASTGAAPVVPALAAAATPEGTWAGYTVIGDAATTAVGLVRLGDKTRREVALVPGTAYGQRYVAAAPSAGRAVFAVTAPKRPGKDPEHEVHVRFVQDGAPGAPTVLTGPAETADEVAMSAAPDERLVVAFSDAEGIYAAWLQCAQDE